MIIFGGLSSYFHEVIFALTFAFNYPFIAAANDQQDPSTNHKEVETKRPLMVSKIAVKQKYALEFRSQLKVIASTCPIKNNTNNMSNLR